MTEVPAGLRELAGRGPAWLRWVDGLTGVLADHLAQWSLRPDGPATPGSNSLVLPVRTAEGTSAVLKIGYPAAEAEQEHLVLRRWGGNGAVRLLSADPHHRVVLLERLGPRTLDAMPAAEACEIVAGLYRRLHVPALPRLRSLSTEVEGWLEDFDELPRNAQIPHRLVEHAVLLGRDLIADDPGLDTVLHGHLHHGRVLAGDREPWLAIAPRPLNGDPHYEVAPMLLHRWDEMSGRLRDGIRARFSTIVDAAGFDQERARAWVIVRAVRAATLESGRGAQADTAKLTSFVALAKAVQD